MSLSNKKIIMIHGLASKPSESVLHSFWSKCLIENIRIDDPDLATEIEAHQSELLHHAYWANATPHHLEDDANYVSKLKKQVAETIQVRRDMGADFHVGGTASKVKAFFRKFGEDLAKIVTGALTIKDDVARMFLREVELYDGDQFIADKMRRPLEEALRKAWDEGRDVSLVSHSMGTFIAYDVLWRFSHRSVPGFKEYRNRKVQMLVTMGSPLGDSVVRDLLFARYHKESKRKFLTNIGMWHNYSCLGDVVSHPSRLTESYFDPMRKSGLLNQKKHLLVDYDKLYNPFEVVTHKGNKKKVKRNPHKSYGYLVQPRLGSWMANFLKDELVFK